MQHAHDATDDRPTLIVLAAGLGSRFGGDKQVANVGPHGETILDFTAFDALRAGFAETILVVRRENRQLVDDLVGARIARRMPVRYAFQDTAEPLPGVHAASARRKPWGTAHALACALRGLSRPCGVVNADDWYSPSGMQALARLLGRRDAMGALVTYPLGRTLSPNGPVNRAVCTTDEHNRLTAIVETVGIVGRDSVTSQGWNADGSVARTLANDTPVSLNLWGFQTALYGAFIAAVEAWIHTHLGAAEGECMLPLVAMEVCARHGWDIRCHLAQADWTGLTYQADRAAVQARLAQATLAGDYPSPLW
jgi:hypothetical protein